MGAKSNQHYVPQHYFRFFSQDGKSICILNKKTGQVAAGAPINRQSSKNYFYGTTVVEDAVTELEVQFGSVLKLVRADWSLSKLTSPEHHLLLQAVAFQRARTMSARRRNRPLLAMLQLISEADGPNSDVYFNETITEEQAQGLEMSQAILNAGILLRLRPLILENKTNRPFIFSDAPAVFTNERYYTTDEVGVLGYATLGLQLFLPLSAYHVLAFVDEEVYRVKGARNDKIYLRKSADVALLNRLQIHSASSTVYFADFSHKDYVRSLWEQERSKLIDTKLKTRELTSVDGRAPAEGVVLHSFEPHIPIQPRLSFFARR